MQYTIAEENYIKSVYHLQQQSALVATNHLAEALQTQPASVTDMVKKLTGKKLVHYERYKGVRLNAAGKRLALQIIRKHRLWEYFLVNTLEFGWDEVHEVAEQLEHVSSSKLIEQLDRFLGYPRFDPHGDPIPDKQGKLAYRQRLPILEQPHQQWLEITAVGDESPALLEMLGHHHIQLGTRVRVLRSFSFDGSIEISVADQKPVTISNQLAKTLLVKIIEHD
jgi:DtxR family Mn-dependent transcriptional regulator